MKTLLKLILIGTILINLLSHIPLKCKESLIQPKTNEWTHDEQIEFRMAAVSESSNYIDDFIYSKNLEDWTFTKFDDTEKILTFSKYTVPDHTESQLFIYIFEYDDTKKTALGHFLKIGDVIYFDDGSCNEFFDQVSNLFN